MRVIINVEAIQRKSKFLKKFKSGFKKLEFVGQQLKNINVQQLRFMAQWAVNNQLLIRGQTGYYKISDKGLKWISLAEELAKAGAFPKLKLLQGMAPKSGRQRSKKHEQKTNKACANNGTCHLIK